MKSKPGNDSSQGRDNGLPYVIIKIIIKIKKRWWWGGEKQSAVMKSRSVICKKRRKNAPRHSEAQPPSE